MYFVSHWKAGLSVLEASSLARCAFCGLQGDTPIPSSEPTSPNHLAGSGSLHVYTISGHDVLLEQSVQSFQRTFPPERQTKPFIVTGVEIEDVLESAANHHRFNVAQYEMSLGPEVMPQYFSCKSST